MEFDLPVWAYWDQCQLKRNANVSFFHFVELLCFLVTWTSFLGIGLILTRYKLSKLNEDIQSGLLMVIFFRSVFSHRLPFAMDFDLSSVHCYCPILPSSSHICQTLNYSQGLRCQDFSPPSLSFTYFSITHFILTLPFFLFPSHTVTVICVSVFTPDYVLSSASIWRLKLYNCMQIGKRKKMFERKIIYILHSNKFLAKMKTDILLLKNKMSTLTVYFWQTMLSKACKMPVHRLWIVSSVCPPDPAPSFSHSLTFPLFSFWISCDISNSARSYRSVTTPAALLWEV